MQESAITLETIWYVSGLRVLSVSVACGDAVALCWGYNIRKLFMLYEIIYGMGLRNVLGLRNSMNDKYEILLFYLILLFETKGQKLERKHARKLQSQTISEL